MANLQKLVAHCQKLMDEVHERKIKCLHNLKSNKQLESELDAIKHTLIGNDFFVSCDHIKWKRDKKRLVGDQLIRL